MLLIAVRALILYAVLVVVMRLMGKRQIGHGELNGASLIFAERYLSAPTRVLLLSTAGWFTLKPEWDLRLFTQMPRNSKAWWKDVYARRTASERTNKRQKIDYQLEKIRTRSNIKKDLLAAYPGGYQPAPGYLGC